MAPVGLGAASINAALDVSVSRIGVYCVQPAMLRLIFVRVFAHVQNCRLCLPICKCSCILCLQGRWASKRQLGRKIASCPHATLHSTSAEDGGFSAAAAGGALQPCGGQRATSLQPLPGLQCALGIAPPAPAIQCRRASRSHFPPGPVAWPPAGPAWVHGVPRGFTWSAAALRFVTVLAPALEALICAVAILRKAKGPQAQQQLA